jgi:hypothetical protein
MWTDLDKEIPKHYIKVNTLDTKEFGIVYKKDFRLEGGEWFSELGKNNTRKVTHWWKDNYYESHFEC